MVVYHKIALSLIKKFEQVFISQIPGNKNTQADTLARLATSEGATDISGITIIKLSAPLGSQAMIAQVGLEVDNWTIPIIKYIQNGELPEDKIEARRFQMRVARYVIIDDQLYKQGFALPMLKCVTPEVGKEIMK